MLVRRLAVLFAVTIGMTACGAKHEEARPFPDDPQVWARATTEAQQRSLAVLASDVTRLRAATSDAEQRTLMGTPAVRETTDRFVNDLNRSPVDLLSKNRIIDHAAAAA